MFYKWCQFVFRCACLEKFQTFRSGVDQTSVQKNHGKVLHPWFPWWNHCPLFSNAWYSDALIEDCKFLMTMYVRFGVPFRFLFFPIHLSSLCRSRQLSAFSLMETSLVKNEPLLVYPLRELLPYQQRQRPFALVYWCCRLMILSSERLAKKKTYPCSPQVHQFDSCVFFQIEPHLPWKVAPAFRTIRLMLTEVGRTCPIEASRFLWHFLEKSIPGCL